jgi:5'/3'-nucleotidase
MTLRGATFKVLVTNDDGIDAPGIRTLARLAAEAGHDVVVAAPDHEHSGASAMVSAVEQDGRVVVERRDLDGLTAYAVAGSPAFIALMALSGAFGEPADVVLSGVNRGANAGRAVLHSGTVGAALTAAQGGMRGVAVSLDVLTAAAATVGSGGAAIRAIDEVADDDRHWATAARIGVDLVPAAAAARPGTVLNVNAPDVPYDRLAGVRRARLARFGQVQMTVVESGEGFVRTSLEATGEEPEPGTDIALLAGGYASVTAIAGLGVVTDVPLPGVQ